MSNLEPISYCVTVEDSMIVNYSKFTYRIHLSSISNRVLNTINKILKTNLIEFEIPKKGIIEKFGSEMNQLVFNLSFNQYKSQKVNKELSNINVLNEFIGSSFSPTMEQKLSLESQLYKMAEIQVIKKMNSENRSEIKFLSKENAFEDGWSALPPDSKLKSHEFEYKVKMSFQFEIF